MSSLIDPLSKLSTASPEPAPSEPMLSRTSRTGSPSPFHSSSPAPVLDNGTNIGQASGRKASLPGKGSFSMERKGSLNGGRRGSGTVLTPSGGLSVYHTRTNVSLEPAAGGRDSNKDIARKTDKDIRMMWSSPMRRKRRLQTISGNMSHYLPVSAV